MDLLQLKGVMSEGYGFIPKKVMRDKTINIISKSIYAYLCSYSGRGSTAFPSQSLICHDLSISKGTLSKYLKELKDKGYVKVEQKRDKGNKYLSNVYSIELEPCTISPHTEKAVADETVNGQMNTNKNSINNNNSFNNKQSLKKEYIENPNTEKIYNEFSNICTSLPKPRNLSDKRKKAIDKILKEYTVDDIMEVFKNTEKSDWLTGRSGKGWQAGFDWIFTPVHFLAILEGSYNNKQSSNPNAINTNFGNNDEWDAIAREQEEKERLNGECF